MTQTPSPAPTDQQIGQPAQSAFVVFQTTTIDHEKAAAYVARALPTVAAHGGRLLRVGPQSVLADSLEFEQGAVFEFPSRASAAAWYASTDYQSALPLRHEALKCAVVLIG